MDWQSSRQYSLLSSPPSDFLVYHPSRQAVGVKSESRNPYILDGIHLLFLTTRRASLENKVNTLTYREWE